VKPYWNDSFKRITGYKYEDIEECSLKLYTKYEKFFCKNKQVNKSKINKVKPASIEPINISNIHKINIDLKLNSSRTRGKETTSISNKVKQKISQMKENNPDECRVTPVINKPSSFKYRNNSS
jgi:hypothetical protein